MNEAEGAGAALRGVVRTQIGPPGGNLDFFILMICSDIERKRTERRKHRNRLV